jgi:hypothetical protein
VSFFLSEFNFAGPWAQGTKGRTLTGICRFPETKGRTLEEIGALFGDTHIASRWYGMSEEEKARVAREAVTEHPESGEDIETGREKSGVVAQERV